jgi:hypothetical protein
MMNKTKPQRLELLILKTQAQTGGTAIFWVWAEAPPPPHTHVMVVRESFNEAVSTTQIINVEFSQEMIMCDKVEGIRKEEAGLFLTFNIVNVSSRLPCCPALNTEQCVMSQAERNDSGVSPPPSQTDISR